MAALIEKRASRALSYSAIGAAALFSGWLWQVGKDDPQHYVLTMTYNHHAGYGSANVSCNECHVPEESGGMGFFTTVTCSTSACHGELLAATPDDEKRELATQAFFPMPDAEELGARYLAQHERSADLGMSCTDCHSEHTPVGTPAKKPDWWDSVTIARAFSDDYVSITE